MVVSGKPKLKLVSKMVKVGDSLVDYLYGEDVNTGGKWLTANFYEADKAGGSVYEACSWSEDEVPSNHKHMFNELKSEAVNVHPGSKLKL